MIDLGTISLPLVNGPYGGWSADYRYTAGLVGFGQPDDSIVVFFDYGPTTGPNGKKNGPYFEVRVFDPSGDQTYYTSGALAGHHYIDTINPLGGGHFIVVDDAGNSLAMLVHNHRLNNATPILLQSASGGVSNPCYSGSVHNVFYDGLKNILIAGFYESNSQYGGLIFSSSYKPNLSTGVLVPLYNGYVGNYEQDYDPFDQTGGSGVSEPIRLGILSNGQSAVQYTSDNFMVLGREEFNVDPGVQSDCNTPSGANVTTRGLQSFILNDKTGYTAFLIDFTMPGLIGANQEDYAFFIFGDGVEFIGKAESATTGGNPQQLIFTPNYVWAIGGAVVNEEYFNGGIFRLPLTGVNNGSVLNRFVVPTVNNVRPISLAGRYKA